MFPSLLSVFLLFSTAGEVTTALALFGRQQPKANATLALDKRQGTVLVTRFSTIFSTGDASKVRTANGGFDCRVDLLNDLWGFCPTSVIAATDCGLAGACVDSFSCSKGCGFTGRPLTTFTCSDSSAPFCSTALLTLANNVGPYTYLACAGSPLTDEYKAFTTSAKPSSTSKPPPTTSPSTSSSPRETDSTSNTASSSSPQTPQSTSPSNTTPLQAGSGSTTNPNAQSTTDAASSSPNNTAAIIGGTVGCIALICICSVVIVFIRRNRNAAAAAAATAAAAAAADSDAASGGAKLTKTAPSETSSQAPPEYKTGAYYQTAELSGTGPAAYDSGNWRVQGGAGWYPPMTPVELPVSGGGFQGGRGGR